MNHPSQRRAATNLLLRKLERFAPLPAALEAALTAMPLRIQDHGRGEVIAAQGERPDETMMVVEGIVFRFKILSDGTRQILSLQLPGDFTDLQAFVLKPLDHSVSAGTAVRVARVPHAALQAVLDQHPQLGRALMRDMALDAAISREWLAAMGRRSAYQRLAHLFCELYFRKEKIGGMEENSLDMRLTQTDIGDACGLSTVHANRSLQALRKDKLIVLENHTTLYIPDIDALMDAAAYDPAYLYLTQQDWVRQTATGPA